ncbi:MAG: sugar transferase [Ignavibacteria bacterium]|jgi:exopolysaccharide biosynthesis polyprenyl glycosylphosphotransferase|nr:sugar transferase [Ignavibacteria bacterium]
MPKMQIIHNSKKSQILFQIAADLVAIWVAFALQLYIRFFSGLIQATAHPNFFDYISGSLVMTMFWLTIFAMFGMYKNWHIRSPFAEFYAILKTVFFGTLIIIFLIFSTNTSSIRVLFLVYFSISAFTFTLFRFIARKLQVSLRKRKIVQIPTIIIGNIKKSLEIANNAEKSENWGFKIIGIILFEQPTEQENELLTTHIPILGTITDFANIIDNHQPEAVIFSSGIPNTKTLFGIETICQKNKIDILINPNLYDHFTGRTRTQNIYGIPLIEVTPRLLKQWQSLIKRSFDILFSLCVIIIGIPFWLLVCLIIRIESKGSPIYSQPRIGKNNKPFTIYKFRSMTQTLCADPDNPQWTKVGDPRVTTFGKFIRKTHIDEIPQFYNVLIGDMSIVGPRPEQPKFVEDFATQLEYYNRRHIVRPGITGWWQVKYKSHILDLNEIKSRTKDDFYYIENVSLQLDFEIIIRTVWCVITGHGQT